MEVEMPTMFEKSNKIFNKTMSLYDNRLASFKNWPKNHRLKPEKLSEAGFYYIGESDKTACFYCGVHIHEWLTEDDPWIEHCLHMKHCTFVYLHKSKLNVSYKKEDDSTPTIKQYMVTFVISLFFISLYDFFN